MLDFPRLAKDKGIPFLESGHHHAHEGWGQTHCPFCADGSYGWHLGFNLESGYFSCWRCGKKTNWNVLKALLPRENIRTILAEYSDGGSTNYDVKTVVRLRSARKPPKMVRGLKRPHRMYLLDRNFDPDALSEEWELYSTGPLSEDWKWRIVTPIKNSDGQTVGYTGRSLNPNGRPRWRTSSKEELREDPRKLLYGIEKVQDRVLIVEGPSDVRRMGPGAVGLLGIDWKVEQAAILRKIPHRFIMFDPESQAQIQARKLADWLSPFSGETELITGIKTDPGGLSQLKSDNIMRELGFR